MRQPEYSLLARGRCQIPPCRLYAKSERLIAQTAGIDTVELGRRAYQIWLPQDVGQAGKVQAKDFSNMLRGFDVHLERESGDKQTRARPFAAQAEAGNINLVRCDWVRDYLDECASFPTGRHDDQVDASSGAFGALILYRKQSLGTQTVRGMKYRTAKNASRQSCMPRKPRDQLFKKSDVNRFIDIAETRNLSSYRIEAIWGKGLGLVVGDPAKGDGETMTRNELVLLL
ncbi:MAG: phage terminase large subunit [Alphaproteobacteria bacterium]